MMASREKIKKKKTKAPSPGVKRKTSVASSKTTISRDVEEEEKEIEMPESVQGSQVSVRSADEANIKDNTAQDPSALESEDTLKILPTPSEVSPRPTSSEAKKVKTDHVEEKLEKKRSKFKPAGLVPKQERKASPSPVRGRNNVAPAKKEGVSMGSAVSLRSNVSRTSREAWVEREAGPEAVNPTDHQSTSSKCKTSSRGPNNVVSLQPLDNKTQDGLKGIKVEAEEDSPEKHAYIPYLYARNCIAKIMEDMKKMKTNHIVIVENIQHHYTSIESETQEQFNMFVICMKQDYASKRSTFREMIDKHRVETERKERYWNEMLASLAERNNRLLREKKTILIKNKTEIERLEREKAEINKSWEEKASAVPAPVPVAMAHWEEEKKILEDQLENEKLNVASLEKQLAMKSLVATPTVGGKEFASVEHTASAASGARGEMVVGLMAMTKENNSQMEKERKEMEEERQRLTEERNQLEEERQGFGGERQKWLTEISGLQSQLGDKNKEGVEWKMKHDVLQGRLEEVSDIQAKYLALENQYAALSLLVKNSDTSSAVKDEMAKTAEERKMMEEERSKLEADIKKFEAEFAKKNGRKPSEDDKSDSVRELYETLGEVKTMVVSLEQKESTFRDVEKGTVPEPPEVSHKPVDTRPPEIITVEVKVPDPSIVYELERVHEKVTITQTQVVTLQQEMSNLRGQISTQNDEIAKLKLRIVELEGEVASLKAGGSGTGPVTMAIAREGGGVSEEDMEALKKENRELKRDMKKMIKQYERLASRQKGEGGTGDESEQISEMTEALTVMDNKIADLEAENEHLKEERIILKEKVRTITETITITNGEDNKKLLEDKEKKIQDLLKELEDLRGQNTEMQKDILKMVKSHGKSKARLDELKDAEKALKMLEVVVMLIHKIHRDVPDASHQVNSLLDDSENLTSQSKQVLDLKQAAYQKWVDKYEAEHGKLPGKKDGDREAEKLLAEFEIAKRDFKEKHLTMSALKLIQTGDMKHADVKADGSSAKAEIELAQLESALASADNRVIDLEADNRAVSTERDRYKQEVQELEQALEEVRKQMELQATVMADAESSAELTKELSDLQKKCDGFESELMQERLSHVNTRDELETLRKQLDVVREEMENEKQGSEAQLESVKNIMAAQIQAKEEELKTLQDRTNILEAERLSNLPPDTAKEIKELQDKLQKVEKDKSINKSSSVALTGQIAELTAKLEVATKNLETQRASNRELEAKVKANRIEKEKETKRVSKHMEDKNQKAASEDKQRINMLVKRVKELEAQAGKGQTVAVAPVRGPDKGDAQVHVLKRQVQDQELKIKQLEKELRQGGGAGVAKETTGDKMKAQKHEKILKDLDKKLEHEKEKSTQLLAGLKAADEENKELQKELEEKSRSLVKVSAELKTISMAAKEGVEAAAKVKELEVSNKALKEENNVLTKNFESERVLRKKYYNMVEDMKGKIRVYCRARPMSRSELERGNKSVLKSVDEYSISVEAARGMKEFQYDAVFMEDSTQEKIFEDTNNLIQSAFDGYNVCIFAYGQTGSGKTFTMIGDKDQKYPGIAPRAFQRVFQMADEVKDKFTMRVEVYMMELYNEKLIDLFAKPSSDDTLSKKNKWMELLDEEKLEIKKDKKGMVFVQGAVVKAARNSKELFALFEEGSTNRHTASTKMNAESSRSHLVIGIILETTNKNTGNITRGKLSLVDLAGSERVAKTQAGAEQLKEAMSINKSLSALGDVISALSSEQQFIPYRNNKLTMLMQDSLGGNAKTLMFVNISPADYNMDETVISLTYASRVKLITNDASKNADNKEIARLKAVINKLKHGENVEDEDI